jgi:uncharacterized integral membrane protein
MALLHRDRPDTTTDDTVAAPGTTSRPFRSDEPVVVRKNSLGRTLATIIATVLLVAIVAIAAANTEEVGVDLLFEEYDPPLAVLVGGAAGAGFLIGALLMAGRHRRTRF